MMKQLLKINPYAATHDELTGLPNNFLFSDRLINAISVEERSTSRFAILIIKINEFDTFGEMHGKDTTDELLIHITCRLNETLREADSIGRLEDDKFAVLLTHVTSKETINPLIWRMQKRLEQPYNIKNHNVNISCAIGLSIYPDHGTSAPALTRHANAHISQLEKNKPSPTLQQKL